MKQNEAGWREEAKINQSAISRLPAEVQLIGTFAVEAALYEAACAPAPGLVDRFNQGAHTDMDLFSFLSSSSAIGPGLFACAAAGWRHRGDPTVLFNKIRPIGQETERAMFRATQGVNTQKGLIFLLGTLAAAAAQTVRRQQPPSAAGVLLVASVMTVGLTARELAPLRDNSSPGILTAGKRLFLTYGVTGIRGELEAGAPAVLQTGLPCLRAALANGLTVNDALVQTLLALMTVVDDTTILHRHDMETLLFVRQQAREVLAIGGMNTAAGRKRILDMDRLFNGRRISPGGSADLLAAAWFLHRLEKNWDTKEK